MIIDAPKYTPKKPDDYGQKNKGNKSKPEKPKQVVKKGSMDNYKALVETFKGK